MLQEIENELKENIIPFWLSLKDEEYGGYYGLLSQDLVLDKKAEKGCILNSRILWFFSNAYIELKDDKLLTAADHAYQFLTEKCIDKEFGGVYWSVEYDGKPLDTMKHTYNQAFAIYSLASYYAATGNEDAIGIAMDLFHVIEEKCMDEYGYMEAFSREFEEITNEALSENGIIARKTMNTILHIMEAYTELFEVTKNENVKNSLIKVLDTFEKHIFNKELRRLEVFFDDKYNSILDLHSYGHDIEASWLLDLAKNALNIDEIKQKISIITDTLADRIYNIAYDGHSVLNECENGVDNVHRVWWIQAESIVGFINAYEKNPSEKRYLEAAKSIWEYIKEFLIDKRPGSEWFWEVDENGKPYPERPIVEPWKCPYHNGRMCLEVIKRLKNKEI